MAIDFPDSPSVGDQFVASGKTYQWDGTVWTIYGPQTNPDIFKVNTTNNRVGINNASPTTALDVVGDIRVYDASTGGHASAGQFMASGTGANVLPSGTTAQRPANTGNGAIRYNTTLKQIEFYSTNSSGWVKAAGEFSAVGGTEVSEGSYKIHVFKTSATFIVSGGEGTVEYFIVAGGGGGGTNNGGAGGGAGGLISGFTTLSAGSYSIVVGSGGSVNTIGDNSSAFGFTAIGGGRGENQGQNAGGGDGGSGGGAAGGGGSGTASTYLGGSGTQGQGNDGGRGWYENYHDGAGGGGGAGGAGQNGVRYGGDGGVGSTTTIISSSGASGAGIGEVSGLDLYFAGGGGGAAYADGPGDGGLGGGGNGSAVNQQPTSGQVNTGGGGGGGGSGSSGGSGVVIVKYLV